MSNSSSSPRRLGLVVIVAVLVIGLGVGGYFLFFDTSKLPEPGTPLYEDYLDNFQVGTAASDVGRDEVALPRLSEAVEKVPGEPAAWANRGLLHLRKNQLSEADRDLKKAHKLAPESDEIESLLGLLADKRGEFTQAANHYRKALAGKPDVTTMYALVQILTKEAGPSSDEEIGRLLDDILKEQPSNLFVLGEKAYLALRCNDEPTLRSTLAGLKKLSANWNELALDAFAVLEKRLANPLPADITATFLEFINVFKQQPGYQRSMLAVNPSERNEKFVGTSLQQFLRLKPPRPNPATPDNDLKFASQSPAAAPAVANARWDLVIPVWLDFDSAEPVLFVANGREVRRTTGDTPALPFPGGSKDVPPSANGVLAFDWNNDYKTDLLLAGAGGLRFWQQNKEGGFTEVTAKTGLDPAILQGDYFGAWAADIEMDGDLDVILAPRNGPVQVLRNNRDGTFKVITPFGAVKDARAFAWADFDHDGAPDAAFLDGKGQLHLFANERSLVFRERELPKDLGTFLALAVADVNDDGVLDLLALRSDGAILRLSDKDKGRSWEVAELARWTDMPAGLAPGSVRLFVADLDNNGAVDLLVAGPQGGRAWLADGKGNFTPLTARWSEPVCAIADLNRDGRLDLLGLSGAGQPVHLLNTGTKSYHWQALKPRANKGDTEGDDRINSFAIGGTIEVRSGTLVQTQPISGPVVHFGLGERQHPDLVRIVWPNGAFQIEFDQEVDAQVIAEQRLKTSCPFLFTWDGRQMTFVADFMWSTPLGMYINGQDKGGFLQTQDWVKIRGDQLVPRDGYYDVRVLANLWETHYLDHLSLIAVDHPADTEVFVDERFFLTATKPEVFLTTPPKPVPKAWDQKGNDVTEIVRKIDGRYLDTFPHGRFQGVATDHWVEVDLGDDAPTQGPVWLLAYGFVYPTDSSINLAISQGKHDSPRGLELEIPDGQGGWKVGRPALGFPAGKNKTVMIRLDGIDGSKGVARRFRLRTNMEIYWDALSYATGLDPKGMRQEQVNAEKAELRFHGISQMTRTNRTSPSLPHYDRLENRPQFWRDLIGFHTRFGDVRELVEKIDDRYVIMNAGDEIALRFAVPKGPPTGWKRDFVWVSEGWVKDGDLNTKFGKTVLPLPYHAMTSYDTPPGRLEDDPVYQRFPQDWKNYHTRYVTPTVYELGLRSFRRVRP
jgi:cytochrome c-type biogenesis protein CcmH/NrfG